MCSEERVRRTTPRCRPAESPWRSSAEPTRTRSAPAGLENMPVAVEDAFDLIVDEVERQFDECLALVWHARSRAAHDPPQEAEAEMPSSTAVTTVSTCSSPERPLPDRVSAGWSGGAGCTRWGQVLFGGHRSFGYQSNSTSCFAHKKCHPEKQDRNGERPDKRDRHDLLIDSRKRATAGQPRC